MVFFYSHYYQRLARIQLSMLVLTIGAEYATRDAPYLTMKKVSSNLDSAIITNCGHFVTE